MTMLDLDRLFAIAEASPFLDGVEQALRQAGHGEDADVLAKLQQDAGIQIDRELSGYEENEPAPGPETARLNAAYEPVTYGRLDILRLACGKLPAENLRNGVAALLQTLDTGGPPSTAAPPVPGTPDL